MSVSSKVLLILVGVMALLTLMNALDLLTTSHGCWWSPTVLERYFFPTMRRDPLPFIVVSATVLFAAVLVGLVDSWRDFKQRRRWNTQVRRGKLIGGSGQ